MDASIEYYDDVVIERYTGRVDDDGNEIRVPIYEGKGLLQISTMSSNRYDGFEFEHEPLVFIPVNDRLFRVNDTVIVTTLNGRTLEYTINNYESIKDDVYEELNDTCIWLKDGKEVF